MCDEAFWRSVFITAFTQHHAVGYAWMLMSSEDNRLWFLLNGSTEVH